MVYSILVFIYLGMLTVVHQIKIFFIATALIILRAMTFPIAQAHPAEVMFTGATLHVIATSIFLYANLTFGTVL